MAAGFPNKSLGDYPSELVNAVVVDSSRDADMVGFFLHSLGFRGTPEKPLHLPSRLLIQLGVAMRLLCWESQGFFYHREAGLPEAREAVLDAFRSIDESRTDPTDLCIRVMRISVERFAWLGRRDVDADVALEGSLDDAALDALAEYLWASRHTES